ncbi:hypothetical protein SK110_2022 [Lactococcus cremoris]|nr:hypothetical protein LMG6897_1010 [Lactococcus cremoris]KZK41408.1 hypothetical protein B40_2038 [Lactococcus cremoris]KZK45330.1 hypothetical protein SK110_2022 [Lactococcus cremoris]
MKIWTNKKIGKPSFFTDKFLKMFVSNFRITDSTYKRLTVLTAAAFDFS